MIPRNFRTDYDPHLDPNNDRPSLTDEADPQPIRPPLTGPEREEANQRTTRLLNQARRNAYPITRCDVWDCHTTVDFGDDPEALCDTCGLTTCSAHTHICAGAA